MSAKEGDWAQQTFFSLPLYPILSTKTEAQSPMQTPPAHLYMQMPVVGKADAFLARRTDALHQS